MNTHLTTSYIIPCYWGHFKHLEGLLDLLCKQTVLPDEVVISLSETNRLNSADISGLENKGYPFPVKIIKHKEKLFAGANRNSACGNASGEIFILNDADDLPHVQRIEIIRHVFENSDAQVVMHSYADPRYEPCDIFKKYQLSSMHWDKLQEKPCPWVRRLIRYPKLCHGPISIRRGCFDILKWQVNHMDGEDCKYCQRLFDQIGHIYYLDMNLYMYRNDLSSHGGLKLRKMLKSMLTRFC